MGMDDTSDEGHEALIRDMTKLLVDIELYKFHDFHKNGLDAPKSILVSRLKALIDAVTSGLYDN